MLAVVGKATPHPSNGDLELFLRQFEAVLHATGAFAYAWSFNPDSEARSLLDSAVAGDAAYLYLPAEGGLAPIRMRISDFRHESTTAGSSCPHEWSRHCIKELSSLSRFGPAPHQAIHTWFLIDSVERLHPPVDLRGAFVPALDRYRKWGQSYFAFLTD